MDKAVVRARGVIGEFLEGGQMRLKVHHSPPEKVSDGLMVIADGTDWNPGSGAGLYLYLGGAWQKL